MENKEDNNTNTNIKAKTLTIPLAHISNDQAGYMLMRVKVEKILPETIEACILRKASSEGKNLVGCITFYSKKKGKFLHYNIAKNGNSQYYFEKKPGVLYNNFLNVLKRFKRVPCNLFTGDTKLAEKYLICNGLMEKIGKDNIIDLRNKMENILEEAKKYKYEEESIVLFENTLDPVKFSKGNVAEIKLIATRFVLEFKEMVKKFAQNKRVVDTYKENLEDNITFLENFLQNRGFKTVADFCSAYIKEDLEELDQRIGVFYRFVSTYNPDTVDYSHIFTEPKTPAEPITPAESEYATQW